MLARAREAGRRGKIKPLSYFPASALLRLCCWHLAAWI
jgi:hypothetical protein